MFVEKLWAPAQQPSKEKKRRRRRRRRRRRCSSGEQDDKVGDSIGWRTGYLLGTIHTSFGERRHN